MVASETRERILAIAAEQGFQPNPAARALTTGRTGIIGLIMPTLTNPFFAPLVLSAQEAAARAGTLVLVATSEYSVGREQDIVDRIAGQVDGFIMVAPMSGDHALRRLARAHPLILVDRTVGKMPAVLTGTAASLGEAAGHLISLGHQRIAYIGGPPQSWADGQRRQVLRDRAEAAGVSLTLLGPAMPAFDAGITAAGQLPPDVTAVIAYNSSLTLGLLHALVASGVRVPEDISLVSGDDLAAFGAMTPGITAVEVPFAEVGDSAVDGLRNVLAGAGTQQPIIVPGRLILRTSTRGPNPERAADPARVT
jgi:LacI family transcriptional regulator